jgi:hypothetical protein
VGAVPVPAVLGPEPPPAAPAQVPDDQPGRPRVGGRVLLGHIQQHLDQPVGAVPPPGPVRAGPGHGVDGDEVGPGRRQLHPAHQPSVVRPAERPRPPPLDRRLRRPPPFAHPHPGDTSPRGARPGGARSGGARSRGGCPGGAHPPVDRRQQPPLRLGYPPGRGPGTGQVAVRHARERRGGDQQGQEGQRGQAGQRGHGGQGGQHGLGGRGGRRGGQGIARGEPGTRRLGHGSHGARGARSPPSRQDRPEAGRMRILVRTRAWR